MATTQPLTSIRTRGHRKRQIAEKLRRWHVGTTGVVPEPKQDPIRVVCISDTHNGRTELPPADILIHAGDLTENGSFEEVQRELNWLSEQPHTYKILVAGNHDVLLDQDFLERWPARRYGQTQTKEDLDWGSVIYLQDTSITLAFPSTPGALNGQVRQVPGTHVDAPRKLTIFGSPWTPQYGISAFQYRPDDEAHWARRFATLESTPDIVVTHGPPKHHLDARDFHRAGCPYLGDEIARIRPRLVVFGHIHVSHGRQDVVLDRVQRAYENVMTGWAGWETLAWMAISAIWLTVSRWARKIGLGGAERVTTFVNASIVGGPRNELRNCPIVVEV